MKFATVESGGAERAALIDPSTGMVRPLADPLSMIELFQASGGDPGRARKFPQAPACPLSSVRLRAPIPAPPRLFLLLGNYADHVREGGGKMYDKARNRPAFFMKPSPGAIIGPEDEVVMPPEANQIDWECELAVVIGKGGRNIAEAGAMGHVFGYTVVNDVTERQFPGPADRDRTPRTDFFDWMHGKWYDTFAPMGPWIAGKDEIPDPHSLAMRLSVNGEVKQNSSSSLMIYTIPELIASLSRITALLPGDVISTGTVAGVGKWTGQFLRPGDVMEAQIEGIGALRNRAAAWKKD